MSEASERPLQRAAVSVIPQFLPANPIPSQARKRGRGTALRSSAVEERVSAPLLALRFFFAPRVLLTANGE